MKQSVQEPKPQKKPYRPPAFRTVAILVPNLFTTRPICPPDPPFPPGC